ncbi:hypothetical protein OIU77_022307 [Salix suchowensis]|uniref:Uncharacterized protein n=1 Tax=Salix suchowensis TaxID=1278906 RepID=A0ABQ9BZR7_9ROSI|nr:hypothetical protein OIU77_022307 [Salix suchowensis]
MSAVVSALSACQVKMGSGYLSAFPSELFDRFEAIKPVWAPYYTIHKILAGLVDQYTLADNAQALKMVNITGDPKHLVLAHLFDKPCFLGLLAVQADDISGFHANTHIPIVIGAQMRYEITGDPLYKGSSQASTLNLRIPFWTHLDGAAATINSQSLAIPTPGSFLSVNRKWSSGDKLSLQLPISLRKEAIQDDRHQYASIQAILYGPYLLAGHTSGDWNLKTGSAESLSDSITPIPASYNEQLISFSQDSGNSTFVLTNSNQSITMEEYPKSGTDACLQATFRIVLNESSSSEVFGIKDVIGKSVMLEPFDLPGMLLAQQGTDGSLAVTNSADDDGSSIFRVVSGLDGKDGTVSLESGSQAGCYIYSGVNYKPGQSMKLSCESGSSDTGFNQGASFVMNKGLSEYHPISFVAKGDKRNFLLAPLHSFRDEFYTIYFNIQA